MFLKFSYVFQLFSSYEHFSAKRSTPTREAMPETLVEVSARSVRTLESVAGAQRVFFGRSELDNFTDFSTTRIVLYVRTGKMSSASCPFPSTQPRHVPGGQRTTATVHNVATVQRISTSRQHRACVTHSSALYCCG